MVLNTVDIVVPILDRVLAVTKISPFKPCQWGNGQRGINHIVAKTRKITGRHTHMYIHVLNKLTETPIEMDKSVVSFPAPNHHTGKGLVTLPLILLVAIKVSAIITSKNSGKASSGLALVYPQTARGVL